MAQVFQSLKNGSVDVHEVPAPKLKNNEVLIETSRSLISAGTERMLAEFGRSSWISKARQQPDKVKQAIELAKTNGIFNTIESILTKLEQPLPLGYCNVGRVLEVGKLVTEFKVGDRVVSNGPHSELSAIPQKLCALIPENVSDDKAVFTILAAIGLQGIRLAKPTLGEQFVVSGLGLIGLLTAQILKSNGINVIGIDPDPNKQIIANSLGIETLKSSDYSDLINYFQEQTITNGVDGVIITAATASSEPIDLAAEICRKRGRIILVGVTGLNLRRDLFYKKEISFQVSCSYGPGRYDPDYEYKSNDYPIGFVRWTEQRNFTAILSLFSQKKIKTQELITHKYYFKDIANAYELLVSSKNCLGILIEYEAGSQKRSRTLELRNNSNLANNKPEIALINFIGAGNYAGRVLIPAFKKCNANFHIIGDGSGKGSFHLARQFAFNKVTTDMRVILEDNSSNALVIATRHDSHAELVLKALKKNKHIFVEKPLCLTLDQLASIQENLRSNKILMVGFNRRFSPLVQLLKTELEKINSKSNFIYTCNAGSLPNDHWLLDPVKGGGRLIGEACHFVDLIRYLANSPIQEINFTPIETTSQSFYLTLKFKNGSSGSIQYLTNGSYSFPKERLEVFSSGKVFQLDNYRTLKGWGVRKFRTQRLFNQNKGQYNCAKAFLDAIQNGDKSPIPFDEIFDVQYNLLNSIKT